MLSNAIEGYAFEFHVLPAAPQEVVESALENAFSPDHVHGTQLHYDSTGRVEGIVLVKAGYGKVITLDDLRGLLKIGAGRVIYVGDGSSDMRVMFHVNQREGFTVAVLARFSHQ